MVASAEPSDWIPFNKPFLTGRELSYIAQAHLQGQLAGDGAFTKKCQHWLEKHGTPKALLTHSCTAALEMAALLCDLLPGDEVIMPSYTFVSTANAFVLRGAVPVFVDIRADTMNIDEQLVERAISKRTRAIVVVHYAGVACEMNVIMDIARRHGLIVIEDAAQGCMSSYEGRPLGTIGDFGCISFHETKNIICGEGGALLINRPDLIERAEIIREKGTNRSKFFRGEVDKYTWTDIGSSYLPGEITAAFLWAQMESAEDITKRRLEIWGRYHNALSSGQCAFRTPIIPYRVTHNAHMYYIIPNDRALRDIAMANLKSKGIQAVFHYVPLHSSPFGRKVGRVDGAGLPVTDDIGSKLIRLPMWIGLSAENQERVIETVEDVFTTDKIIGTKPTRSHRSDRLQLHGAGVV
jgi:dTDP-4-amino-4,6-dideoxygalactose transaminase